MAKIFFDDDADLSFLQDKVVAVLGYGNQGRAQAQNLRDSGINLVIGNREDSYRQDAVEDGFDVLTIREAASLGDVLLMLISDEAQPEVYVREIQPVMKPGSCLVFSSGFNIYFGFIRPSKDLDVVMAAPEMIGLGVRENYLSGKGFPMLIGVENDASGNALGIVLAIAKASGSTKMGALMSSFEEETLVDLMYEHSGILYHIRRVIGILMEAGVSPEAAILGFYASGEEARLAEAYARIGLWHQLPLHSTTSQYGQEVTSLLTEEEEAVELRRLRRIVENIQNGSFAKAWMLEQRAGFPTWHRMRSRNLDHPIIKAERDLYRRMGRIDPDSD